MAVDSTGELTMGEDQEQLIRILLLDLAAELGSRWMDIGRRLGLKEADLENIKADNPQQRERGYQMLLQWRQMTRFNDLARTLIEGLQRAQRVDLADKCGPRIQDLFARQIKPDATHTINAKEKELIEHLKHHFKKRNRVPMVPWAGKNGKIVTVDLSRVYTNLELLVDIDSPDLPIHFRLSLNELFKDVKAVDGNENEIGCEETLATSSTRVVARGRTGSGKTTFMLKLSSDWAEGRAGPMKDAVAVFLLQLKKLDHKSNFGDAVVDQLLHKKDFTPQFIEEFAENNQKRVAVLLDGYDEFKGKGLVQENCGNIVKMLRKEYLPCVQILITTRPSRVGDFMKLEDHITDEYRHLQITGFSSDDIDVYVKKIFERRPELGVKLLNYLEENHLKTELASLPLMCCAFCQLTKLTDGKDFKDMNTISSLFDKLIKCLVKYHPRSKEQRSPLRSWDSTERDETDESSVKSGGNSMNDNEDETEDSVFQLSQIDEDDLVLQLGRVALMGFIRSIEEELIFSLKDFKDCRPGAREVVAMGCKVGILVRDEEAEYRPTIYEDLEINNDDGEVDSHNITFVLKVIQEKLGGSFLAHLSTGNEEERCLFMKCIEDIRTLQRATDLGNVLMFACGANLEAARTIISHVVSLMKSEEENIKLFMSGKLHYTECQRVQKLIEFCLQLNFESQSKGELNDVLIPLLSGCSRLRLVGISSYVTKSLGYFLEHSNGISITSLELIRLHLNSSSEFREFLNTFPGLENDVSDSMKRKRRRKRKQNEEPLTEEKRREKIREGVTKGREIPKYLLQRPDDTFLAVLPLWEQVNQMQMSEWNFGPVIEGLEHCAVEELILNGVKAEPADWEKLFKMFASQSFTSMKRLTLSMNDIGDEHLAKLVPGLAYQSNLTHLKLSGNEVGPDFLDALDECPLMENLEVLVLEKTDMDSESIEQLGDLLTHFPSLSTLDIRRNTDSDDTSIISILDGVQKCPKLERLLISLHKVTEKALNHLQTKNDTLAHLKELHLVHTPVSEKVIECVAGILPVMPNLEDLRISGTPPDKTKPKPEGTGRVSSEVAYRFSEAVLKTPSLRFLSILYTTFGADSFINLLEKSSEATQAGLKTLRFSKACIPEEEEVRRHVRNAEKTFLRIWV